MTHVVEIVLFRLVPTADRAAFLAAAQPTFDLLASYDGYLHRELGEAADGLWCDIVHWRDMETATRAAQEFLLRPEVQSFVAMIDMATVTMTHVSPRLTAAVKA